MAKNGLPRLDEAIIRARSTEASFKRGQSYYKSGAVKRRLHHQASLEAYIEGTETYRVMVWQTATGELRASCTCPYDYGGDCKHIVATLLAWLYEPDSFQPAVDLKAVLNRRSKAALLDLLLDILEVYPHLVDDFEIAAGPSDKDLPDKAQAIFNDLASWGHLSEAEAEARMHLIACRADRLAEQGQTDLARRTYYALVLGCVNLCRSYGSYEYFSASVPYDFAVVYAALACEQVAEQGATIKAEMEEIDRDLDNPERLGLDEGLAGVWFELAERGFVAGGSGAT